jgi:hypothetical protein
MLMMMLLPREAGAKRLWEFHAKKEGKNEAKRAFKCRKIKRTKGGGRRAINFKFLCCLVRCI